MSVQNYDSSLLLNDALPMDFWSNDGFGFNFVTRRVGKGLQNLIIMSLPRETTDDHT